MKTDVLFQYSYLLGVLGGAAVWGVVYLLRRDLRRAMVYGSCLAIPPTFLEPVFLDDYWRPPSLFGLLDTYGLSIESFFFSFAFGGLAPVGYRLLRPLAKDARAETSLHLHRYLALYSMFGAAELLLPFGSMTNIVLTQLLVMAFLLGRGEERTSMMMTGAFGALGYAAALLTFVAVFPDFMGNVYSDRHLWGPRLSGIPLEELAFAFSGAGAYSTMVTVRPAASAVELPALPLPSSAS